MLRNKLIFITGASSGIGEACAHTFAAEGANLILCARNIDKLATLANSLKTKYDIEILNIKLDVRQQADVQAAIANLASTWQAIDILINNAGLAAGLEPLQTGNITDWDAMLDTNVKGLLYVTKAILPKMLERDTGHIINIGSIAGHTVYPKGVVYCASKHAVKAITEGLRMDLFGSNIRVSSIDPGAVETNFSLVRFKGDTEKANAVYAGMQPLTPQDVAETILFCVTRAKHVNISEIILMPTAQAAATMIARK